MTTPQRDVGAASHVLTEEQTVRQAEKNVRRLQSRIVKATQEGRWNKVKALQRLLTHSQSGRIVAVRRVTQNKGRNTPGVDGVTWRTPGQQARAIETLRPKGYSPRPLRRLYIPKSNGKMRPLGIPTMRDRAMQALYRLALDPIAETLADPDSYGFRTGRSCADAVEQCFTNLSRKTSPQWVMEGDIKSCFDRISHDWLLAHIPMEKAMLRKWLKAGYMEKHVLYATEEGTPQGGIISPVLANLTLDGMETLLRQQFCRKPSEGYKNKVHLIRYADDFVITGNSKELLENDVWPVVEQFLRERGLELSPEKTFVTHIETGFDFLGQNIRKYNGKMLITPSDKSVKTFLRGVADIIKDNKQASAGHLVLALNRKVRGWVNYHRHVVSQRVFSHVDRALRDKLLRWAKRRHPTKGLHWIASKYFATVGGNNWVFYGWLTPRRGGARPVGLYQAGYTPIRRHVKIRRDANPYDPRWRAYFNARQRGQATVYGRSGTTSPLRTRRSIVGANVGTIR